MKDVIQHWTGWRRGDLEGFRSNIFLGKTVQGPLKARWSREREGVTCADRTQPHVCALSLSSEGS